MATIPLMSEQDVEEGDLPSYEETQNRGTKNSGPFNLGKTCEYEESVAAAHVSIRLGFLRKVFGILSFQFAATFAFCFVLYLTPGVRGFVQQQPWILLLTMFGSIGVLFAMFIHSRNAPVNYFLLGAWTILQALTVAAIVTFFDVEVVIQAVLLTAIVVGSLFVYTLQTKRDFQQHYAIMYTVSCVFLGAICLQIILMSPTFDFLISIAGALFFSIYLVMDVQYVMTTCSEEDYIFACVLIYTDIIGLFIRILEILNEINRH